MNIPKSIRRTLERVDKTIENDIKNGTIYSSAVTINHIKHIGSNSTQIQSEIFKKFKKSLENRTNKLLWEVDRDEAMLNIVDAIWDFYKPFTRNQILEIENDAIIEDGLIKKLEKFRQCYSSDKEAMALEHFLSNPCTSSWAQEDSWCGIREFRLVKSLHEYKKILERNEIHDITTNIKKKTKIHLAFYRINEKEILKQEGLEWDFKRFIYKYAFSSIDLDDAIKKYNVWYDIREKGIYYIYIPN